MPSLEEPYMAREPEVPDPWCSWWWRAVHGAELKLTYSRWWRAVHGAELLQQLRQQHTVESCPWCWSMMHRGPLIRTNKQRQPNITLKQSNMNLSWYGIHKTASCSYTGDARTVYLLCLHLNSSGLLSSLNLKVKYASRKMFYAFSFIFSLSFNWCLQLTCSKQAIKGTQWSRMKRSGLGVELQQ